MLADDAQSVCGSAGLGGDWSWPSCYFVGYQSPALSKTALRNQEGFYQGGMGVSERGLTVQGSLAMRKKAVQSQMEPYLTPNGSWQKTGPASLLAWRVFGEALTSLKLGKPKRPAGDSEFSYQIPDLSEQWWVCDTYVKAVVTRHPVTSKS